MSEPQPPKAETFARFEADLALARQELPLEELLRRCHREELLRLAAIVGANPHGLGTGDLARVCAFELRRRGGHTLLNLVQRGGQGPGYPAVLRELALRLGVPPEATLERTELALVEYQLRRQAEAPASLADRALVTAGLLRLLPLAPLIGAWWLGKTDDDLLLAAVLEVARLRQAVRHRVTVGVVGSPSSGKDAAIAAIFGVKTGNIHPVAGSTREVGIFRLHPQSALFVVNTPGMGDVVQAVTEEARQILHHVDVFLYVLNAQGGVQARELADFRACQATGRPVLAFVNKIDTLRPRDRERYLSDAREKLGAAPEHFLAGAVDPLPQLSPTPIGVEAVQDWLAHQLARLGKDPTELPWVPSELPSEALPPGATELEEPPLPAEAPTLIPG